MPVLSRRSVRRWLRRASGRLPRGLEAGLRRFGKRHATPLHAQLPLDLPETMHIDPTNLCNFRCSFCPTADKELLASVGRPGGVMDLALYERILGQLSEMVARRGRRLSILHLYKDGEPLVNKRIAEMAALAKRAAVAEVVSITTNASLLGPAVRHALIASGLDQIRISVIHVEGERYAELTKTWSDYDKIRENVGALFRERNDAKSHLRIIAKVNDTALSPEQLEVFRRDFEGICDELRVDTLMGWSLSELKDFTLGVAVATGMDGTAALRDRLVCPEPFSRLAVNFDGRVSVCCVDWSFGTVVGDLRRETLEEVWNGEALRRFRLAHLDGRRATIPACAQCQYVKGAPVLRDLDEHATRLRSLYDGPGA